MSKPLLKAIPETRTRNPKPKLDIGTDTQNRNYFESINAIHFQPAEYDFDLLIIDD